MTNEKCGCGHAKIDHNWLIGCGADDRCTCGQEFSEEIANKLCIICGKRRGDHARGKCLGGHGTWFKGKNE